MSLVAQINALAAAVGAKIKNLALVARTGSYADLIGTPGVVIQTSKLTLAGPVSTQNLVARWYPETNITLAEVYFSLGTAPTTSVSIDLRKNGVSVFSGAVPTASAGQYLSTAINLTSSATSADYFTVSVAGTSGSYLVASIVYTQA